MVWYGNMGTGVRHASEAEFTAVPGDGLAIHGAAGYLPDRIGHLYKCQSPPPSDIMQPADRRLH